MSICQTASQPWQLSHTNTFGINRFHEKILRIGGAKKWAFFQLVILIFFFKKNLFFVLFQWKNLGFHMRYHFFLHYGWSLQNLGKEAVWTNMHTTVVILVDNGVSKFLNVFSPIVLSFRQIFLIIIVGLFYSMQSNVWLLRASARSSSRLLVRKGKENKKAHSHSTYFDGGATAPPRRGDGRRSHCTLWPELPNWYKKLWTVG